MQKVAVANNPYQLAEGSKYHLLHVEDVEPVRATKVSSSKEISVKEHDKQS
jgi:hypothetical protein